MNNMYGLLLAQVVVVAILGLFIIRVSYNYGRDAKGLRRFPIVPLASLTNVSGFLHQLFHT